MNTHLPIIETDLPLPDRRAGKVRDTYLATTTDGNPVIAIVATDRLSAFDVILPTPIPDKGKVLTRLSAFWFEQLAGHFGEAIPHHLISTDPAVLAGLNDHHRDQIRDRVMIGQRTSVIPIECVVRGYLAGSGWAEYQSHATVCGITLPPGLQHCDKLPEPIFTPAAKAQQGHDENITFEQACDTVGSEIMHTLRDRSIALYQFAHDYAAQRGIILADTKFEFGLTDRDPDNPILIDEVFTPDSSRFWPADEYAPGRDQPSFDKQYVRNYLQQLVDQGRWDKQPPGPELPEEIVRNTRQKYFDAYQRLTGEPLNV